MAILIIPVTNWIKGNQYTVTMPPAYEGLPSLGLLGREWNPESFPHHVKWLWTQDEINDMIANIMDGGEIKTPPSWYTILAMSQEDIDGQIENYPEFWFNDDYVTLTGSNFTGEGLPYNFTFTVKEDFEIPDIPVFLVLCRAVSTDDPPLWEAISVEDSKQITLLEIPALPPPIVSSWTFDRPSDYDPTFDWSWEDGEWGDWPLIEVRGGGRYRNSIIIVGIDADGLGVLYG